MLTDLAIALDVGHDSPTRKGHFRAGEARGRDVGGELCLAFPESEDLWVRVRIIDCVLRRPFEDDHQFAPFGLHDHSSAVGDVPPSPKRLEFVPKKTNELIGPSRMRPICGQRELSRDDRHLDRRV